MTIALIELEPHKNKGNSKEVEVTLQIEMQMENLIN